jgi:hypothetical protein
VRRGTRGLRRDAVLDVEAACHVGQEAAAVGQDDRQVRVTVQRPRGDHAEGRAGRVEQEVRQVVEDPGHRPAGRPEGMGEDDRASAVELGEDRVGRRVAEIVLTRVGHHQHAVGAKLVQGVDGLVQSVVDVRQRQVGEEPEPPRLVADQFGERLVAEPGALSGLRRVAEDVERRGRRRDPGGDAVSSMIASVLSRSHRAHQGQRVWSGGMISCRTNQSCRTRGTAWWCTSTRHTSSFASVSAEAADAPAVASNPAAAAPRISVRRPTSRVMSISCVSGSVDLAEDRVDRVDP